MELEQGLTNHHMVAKGNNNGETCKAIICNSSRPHGTSSQASNYLGHRSESFQKLEMGVPKKDKLTWLRSQIIGRDAEFDSPFGERRITYADHTASGRCLRYVEDYIINNVLPFYGNTHTFDSYVGQHTTKMVNEATEYMKRCLGGAQHDALMFCGTGTTAAVKRLQEVMGIAVPSTLRDLLLKVIKTEERWVVFIGPYEHHSNLLSWRQSLAEVVEIGLDNNGLIDIEALKEQLESYRHTNRPMLGSFSACSNVTGICSDTRALARLLHHYGAFACFDFAASGPYVEIDMHSGEIDGYDAVFLSPHKFLGGPGCPGILLMSKTLYRLGSSAPSTCGGGTVVFVNGFSEKDTLYVEDIEERENAGTPPIIQKIRAALAFWVKEYIGYEVIEKLEFNNIKKALKRLLQNQNIWVLGNTTAKRQAVLSFLVFTTSNPSSDDMNMVDLKEGSLYMWGELGLKRDKPLHGPFVAKLLNDLFGIQARGGCACAGPYGHNLLKVDQAHSHAFRLAIQKGFVGIKPGWTRLSFPYYMSNEEFEFILDAVEFISVYGQRFLPLYHFNWETGNWVIKKKACEKILTGKENKFKLGELLLPKAMHSLNLDDNISKFNNRVDAEAKDVGTISKYVSYLETAKSIAVLLPKFPSRRRVPDEIDLNILHFRV